MGAAAGGVGGAYVYAVGADEGVLFPAGVLADFVCGGVRAFECVAGCGVEVGEGYVVRGDADFQRAVWDRGDGVAAAEGHRGPDAVYDSEQAGAAV